VAACLLWVWFVMSQLRGLCGTVSVVTSQSRVVSSVPLFSAATTTIDDDAFLDCSHDDIILFIIIIIIFS